jgi:RNA polymerase sigma-70 factor (ECF subfamily)
MRESEMRREDVRAVTYCLVPRDLAPKLHEQLRHHFSGDPSVEAIVESRGAERRRDRNRRVTTAEPRAERRRIRDARGRRVADRRAVQVPVGPPELPRRARAHQQRLAFVECLEPSGLEREDQDTARLVMRIQAGDRVGFAMLYMRSFDRVYSYLRLLLRDADVAEDAVQQVFVKLLEELAGYQARGRPFRAWLFVLVRNHALNELRASRRLEVVAPQRLIESEPASEDLHLAGAFDWITDRELVMFVERLPLAQRQVLLLRYLIDLPFRDIAELLDRTPEDVRSLHKRALGVVRARLLAVRAPRRADRARMRRCVPEARVLRYRRFALGA